MLNLIRLRQDEQGSKKRKPEGEKGGPPEKRNKQRRSLTNDLHFQSYTPLNITPSKILMEIESKKEFPWPNKTKKSYN